jgi:hypothetical protein
MLIYLTPKIFVSQHFDMDVENADFDADFKSIEKSVKKFFLKLLALNCRNFVLFEILVLCTKVFSPLFFFV